MMRPAEYTKAIVAAAVAFVGTGATAAVDDIIKPGEWWMIAAATVTAFGGVFGVGNQTRKTPPDTSDDGPRHLAQ